MKKISNKINMAIIAAMVSTPALAGDPLCDLIVKMQGVFGILRTLAFVGAAFVIAGWAWGYIKDGKFDMEDMRKKGTGMLVGFVLLFALGLVLSFFMSQAGMNSIGCVDVLRNGWNR